MNCFQLIRAVLTEAYAAIPGTDIVKDGLIAGHLKQLAADYRRLTVNGCLDYSDPARRFAYVFRYTTSHANLVYQRICGSATLRTMFDRPRVHLACVGGGPGSDFLGVLKYCQRRGKTPDIKCVLLDRDPTWGESWSDVDDKVGSALKLSTVFNSLDVTKPDQWQTFTKHHHADLFTLIYFVSEVYARRNEAQAYFESLFSNVKQGAVLLFVDNNDSRFVGWFDQLAATHGLQAVENGTEDSRMPLDEDKEDLEPYLTKFGPPKLKADIAWRVLQKT